MPPIASYTPHETRQFLAAMCAQANSALCAQSLTCKPEVAVMAQANLDLKTVLDLLRD